MDGSTQQKRDPFLSVCVRDAILTSPPVSVRFCIEIVAAALDVDCEAAWLAVPFLDPCGPVKDDGAPRLRPDNLIIARDINAVAFVVRENVVLQSSAFTKKLDQEDINASKLRAPSPEARTTYASNLFLKI